MTLSRTTVSSFINDWVKQHSPDFKEGVPTMTNNLITEGIVDSLGFLNLIGALETEFSVELDFGNIDPEQFTTLEGLTSVVIESLKGG